MSTESRFLYIVQLLRDIVQKSTEDPATRLAQLEQQRDTLEQQINVIRETGIVDDLYTTTQLKERFFDYGVDDVFDAPQTAALDGWDYPPLQRVLQGTIPEQGAWEGEAPSYADELTEARLHILERRGRFQQYLSLAEAEGHIEDYVSMLVRLGRVEEAISYGRHYLATPDEAKDWSVMPSLCWTPTPAIRW